MESFLSERCVGKKLEAGSWKSMIKKEYVSFLNKLKKMKAISILIKWKERREGVRKRREERKEGRMTGQISDAKKALFKDTKKIKMGCDFECKYEEVIETSTLSGIGMGTLELQERHVTVGHTTVHMKNMPHSL